MPDLTREFKVGVLFIAATALLVYFILRTDDRPFGFSEGYKLTTTVGSAEGVIQGSAVEIAGVQIGSVRSIQLTPDGKATIELEIDPKFKLPIDTSIALKTRGMLGDRFIQVLPGTSEELIAPGGEIVHFEKGIDVDALTARADTISKDIETISSSLKGLLTSEENQTSVKSILQNTAGLTSDLTQFTKATQNDLQTVIKDISELSSQLKKILSHADTMIDSTNSGVQKQMAALEELTVKLDKTMADVQSITDKVNSITGKIERGEGTIGELLNDRTLVDQVEQTVGEVQDLVATVGRIQTTVSYQGEVFAFGSPTYQGGMRNTLGVEFRPREDYGYRVEIVSDPIGNWTEEWVNYDGTYYDGTQVEPGSPVTFHQIRVTNDFLLSLQFMRRWNDLQLRLGIKDGTGGVGADLYLLDDRLAIQSDLYAFGTYNFYPNLKIQTRYTFLHSLYLGAGVDDILNGVLIPEGAARGVPTRPNVFLGAGFSFQDDQLKLLMSVIPIPGN